MIASFFFIIMSSASALTLQGADLYVTQLRSLRTADLAGLAAANTPTPVVNNSPSTMATATALNIAAINGFGSSTVTTAYTSGSATITTTIATTSSLFLSNVTGSASSLLQQAQSIVKPPSAAAAPCLESLSTYVSIYSSASVQGPNCGVVANSYLRVDSAQLNAGSVQVGFNLTNESYYVNTATALAPTLANFTVNKTSPDPLASNASVVALTSHLSAMSSWPYPTTPPYTPTYPTVTATTDQTYTNTTVTIPFSQKIKNLTLNNANLTFIGSGSADPNCASPIVINGNILLYSDDNITLGSGCYVIGGNINQYSDGTATFTLSPGAIVTMIVTKQITNNSNVGKLIFPDATFIEKTNISITSAGTIAFGKGMKYIGGYIQNVNGILTFGDGTTYMPSTNITMTSGTTTFGNGPFYFFGGSITTGSSGALNFGTGPFYFYNSVLNNGDGSGAAKMTLGGGPYYFYNTNFNLQNNTTTTIGPGDMDLYGGSLNMNGVAVTFGYGGSSITGSSTVSLHGGSVNHTKGTFTANGVTFAADTGSYNLTGNALYLSSPTSSSPTYGKQNLLFMTTNGAMSIAQTSSPNAQMSGMLYAPNSFINLYNAQTFTPQSGGCLSIIASYTNISSNTTLNMSPCTNFTGTTGAGNSGIAKLQ